MKSKKHVTESPHQIMLSHSQREILAILKNRTWRRIGLLTHHSEEKRVSELCRKLEAETSHFIIPPLAAILIHFPIKLRPLLCQTFQRLLEKVSPDQWNFVDQEIRDELLALTYQIDPIKQTLPSPNLKDPSERLIALSHHSGFTRELAIAAIIPPITEATFSLLLLRCIDWAASAAKPSSKPSAYSTNQKTSKPSSPKSTPTRSLPTKSPIPASLIRWSLTKTISSPSSRSAPSTSR